MNFNVNHNLNGLSLNEAQRAAIQHISGPALVLAGPGSGKTTVIINRLSVLASRFGQPNRLLSVTFNRTATLEMQKRYEKNVLCMSSEVKSPHFSTIHSLCYKIVKETEETAMFQLIEGTNSFTSPKSILNSIYKEINGRFISENDLDKIISWISRSRNARIENYPIIFEPQVRNFAKICSTYESYKMQNNYMDYDDLIFKTFEILQKNKRTREHWNLKFDYMQVDEGQDLSITQFNIIRLLCENSNVFVVADDDQSIYGFRGADPSCILKFEKYFPSCVKYYLERNYRSEKEIVLLSRKIVEKNVVRYGKKLFSEKNETGKIYFRHFASGFYQGKYISEGITQGKYGNEIGILYRNNISALIIMAFLCKSGYPFTIAGGGKNLIMHWIIRDFFEILKKFISANKSLLDFFLAPKNLIQIYNKISNTGFFEACFAKCESGGQDSRIVNGLSEFLYAVCKISGDSFEYTALLEQIKIALDQGFFESRRLKKEQQLNEFTNITLSTIHSAKGLEYETVFLIDLMENEFPGRSSNTGPLLEEERRLFYVGMTRAKRSLYFTYPETRGHKNENASVFYCEALSQWRQIN